MTVSVEVCEHVATLRFQHHDASYMTAQTVDALYDALRDIETRPEVRAVILTGQQPGTFITHYSLAEIHRVSEPSLKYKSLLKGFFPLAVRGAMACARMLIRFDRKAPHDGFINRLCRGTLMEGAVIYARANRLIRTLRAYPRPIIAAIHGDAQGYGMELALACDFRIMAQGPYRMGQIETLVGLIPGSGGIYHLQQLVGSAKATELTMLGLRLDANEAEQAGLITQASTPEKFDDTVNALALQLANKSPSTLRHSKRCVRDSETASLNGALRASEPLFMDDACTHQAEAIFRRQAAQQAQGVSVQASFDALAQADLNPPH